jgi:hypothetical protein
MPDTAVWLAVGVWVGVAVSTSPPGSVVIEGMSVWLVWGVIIAVTMVLGIVVSDGVGVTVSMTGVRVGRRVPVLVAVSVLVSVGGKGVFVLVGVGSSQGNPSSGFWINNNPNAASSKAPANRPIRRRRLLSFFTSAPL